MIRSSVVFIIIFCCLMLTACSTQQVIRLAEITQTPTMVPTAVPSLTPTATPQPFRVIGYVTTSMIIEQIPFTQLTHINFAFLTPNSDGTFAPLYNTWKIKSLTTQSHQHGVKVLISIGGWGWDDQFEQIAADPQKRAVFIREALGVVTAFDFDGIDIDWEYPDPGQSAQNYALLIQELREAFPDKLLTTAVIASGDETGLGIPSATFALFDFINVMSYDEPGHASLDQFETSLNYWLDRGVPKEKLVLGIPFYTRPGEVSFKKLVENNPEAAHTNEFLFNGQQERYNSLETVEKKTTLALDKASGVMFWNLEQDAPGDLSLLNAVHKTITLHTP